MNGRSYTQSVLQHLTSLEALILRLRNSYEIPWENAIISHFEFEPPYEKFY